MAFPDKIHHGQPSFTFSIPLFSNRSAARLLACVIMLLGFCDGGLAPLTAQDFPSPLGQVSDFAGILDNQTKASLTNLCREVEEKTGAEIAVATVQTVGDYDYADYANRLFEKWQIGKKSKDNGVLFFLTTGERRVRIEVGYGLEGILPDVTVGRILDNYVIPEFRRGDYGAGMLAGTQAIAGVIAKDAGVEITGTIQPRERGASARRQRNGLPWPLLLLLLFLFLGGSRWFWPLILMGGGGRRGRDDWGGFGGGFGGGGFGGGGFGGFGGGGSGGGGAGRSF